VRAAQQARLSGHVSVGLAPTTATVLGVPLMRAMQRALSRGTAAHGRGLSGHLTTMLHARQLDLAVLFQTDPPRRWSVTPLLEEKLFLIASPTLAERPKGTKVRLRDWPMCR
jgi:LysR family tcuABC transcriptional regulator